MNSRFCSYSHSDDCISEHPERISGISRRLSSSVPAAQCSLLSKAVSDSWGRDKFVMSILYIWMKALMICCWSIDVVGLGVSWLMMLATGDGALGVALVNKNGAAGERRYSEILDRFGEASKHVP